MFCDFCISKCHEYKAKVSSRTGQWRRQELKLGAVTPPSLSFPFFLDLSHFPSLQCIYCYTPVVWGKTASFGGDIGGLGAVPQRGPGTLPPDPLVRGSGGKPLRS